MKPYLLPIIVLVLACGQSQESAIDSNQLSKESQSIVVKTTSTPTTKPTIAPTWTPVPTWTPEPTWTPIPTSTPEPTRSATPISTATPGKAVEPTIYSSPTLIKLPTYTPTPTYTPRPTYTPTPTSTPKPTPEPGTLIGWGYDPNDRNRQYEVGRTFNILEDTVWNEDGSPYTVTHTVRIDEGVKLVIEPGTNIIWKGSPHLRMNPYLIFEPLTSLTQIEIRGDVNKKPITFKLGENTFPNVILARNFFPILYWVPNQGWLPFNKSQCITMNFHNVVLDNVLLPEMKMLESGLLPNISIEDSALLTTTGEIRSSYNVLFADWYSDSSSNREHISTCSTTISRTVLENFVMKGGSRGTFKGDVWQPNLSITESCLINPKITISGTGSAETFIFRNNTVVGGKISTFPYDKELSPTNVYLDMSQNYWVDDSSNIVINPTPAPNKPGNLGEPTPTPVPTSKLILTTQPELSNPHSNTPNCQ